jgi:hypothetical protein
MDHAVALVQAYLQLNGYFTSAEYPIIASAGRKGAQMITDVDILAFRFPSGLPVPGRRHQPHGLDVGEVDSGLGVTPDSVDMIVGEVKEGRVGMNTGFRDPGVLKVVLSRLVLSADEEDRAVNDLLATGTATLASGYVVRLIAFGAFPPGSEVPPCRIISLGHVLEYLQKYLRKHWGVLRHLQFKDPAFGFLMTLEKAKRGGAGRRGSAGVEIVVAENQPRRPMPPGPQKLGGRGVRR